MAGLTSVVLVRETSTASACAVVAPCAEHTATLKTARWARVEEVIGFSSLMDCEACAITIDRANLELAAGSSGRNQAGYLRLLDCDATPGSQTPFCA
jgi:hypothetical protein